MYNMVGFQTRLKFSEQERVFRMIPGLQKADFCRYGVMHRNTYINSPRVMTPFYSIKSNPNIYIAGQITGVEGYVESAGSGLLAGLYAAQAVRAEPVVEPLSDNTMLGAMAAYISDERIRDFQPMNANFGLFPPLTIKIRNKKEKYHAYADRALNEIDKFSSLLFEKAEQSI